MILNVLYVLSEYGILTKFLSGSVSLKTSSERSVLKKLFATWSSLTRKSLIATLINSLLEGYNPFSPTSPLIVLISFTGRFTVIIFTLNTPKVYKYNIIMKIVKFVYLNPLYYVVKYGFPFLSPNSILIYDVCLFKIFDRNRISPLSLP